MRFVKYHGLGNDFIVVDRREPADPLAPLAPLAPHTPLTSDVVVRLCDRHTGVGADGVLSLWPAPAASSATGRGAAARMQVHNSDGSESDMCGNGLRCAARFLYDSGELSDLTPEVTILSGRAAYRCHRLSVDRFRVEMGAAVFAHPELPPADPASSTVALTVAGRRFVGMCVHLGNPHLVIFAASGDDVWTLARTYGAALSMHAAFPKRVNVSFTEPTAVGFRAVVFERGAGITQACGSGACAIAAAAVRSGRWPQGQPVDVALPGGTLTIRVGDSVSPEMITMEGPAVRVFAGEVDLP